MLPIALFCAVFVVGPLGPWNVSNSCISRLWTWWGKSRWDLCVCVGSLETFLFAKTLRLVNFVPHFICLVSDLIGLVCIGGQPV